MKTIVNMFNPGFWPEFLIKHSHLAGSEKMRIVIAD